MAGMTEHKGAVESLRQVCISCYGVMDPIGVAWGHITRMSDQGWFLVTSYKLQGDGQQLVLIFRRSHYY